MADLTREEIQAKLQKHGWNPKVRRKSKPMHQWHDDTCLAVANNPKNTLTMQTAAIKEFERPERAKARTEGKVLDEPDYDPLK